MCLCKEYFMTCHHLAKKKKKEKTKHVMHARLILEDKSWGVQVMTDIFVHNTTDKKFSDYSYN